MWEAVVVAQPLQLPHRECSDAVSTARFEGDPVAGSISTRDLDAVVSRPHSLVEVSGTLSTLPGPIGSSGLPGRKNTLPGCEPMANTATRTETVAWHGTSGALHFKGLWHSPGRSLMTPGVIEATTIHCPLASRSTR